LQLSFLKKPISQHEGMRFPKGFLAFGRNIGIKDDTLDFGVVFSEIPCQAAAVFTRNNYPGSPILVGREHIKSGKAQAIVVNSKNSNVATGERGIEDAKDMCRATAQSLGIEPNLVIPSSTGVIGVPLPMDKIIPACLISKQFLKEANLTEFADAILTTDTKRKVSFYELEHDNRTGVIFGIAKGAGMIEPNMATMLSFIFSDFVPESDNLQAILKRVVDKTYNCLTIDSDTSTSDTVVLLASGQSGTIPEEQFEIGLLEVAKDLTKMIARDGEGATKLIELKVSNAKDEKQAKKIGKSILNSPLVKTAVYGGDPNWGRFVMAVGKVFDELIPYEGLEIFVGGISVKGADTDTKIKLSNYLKTNEFIEICVQLGTGNSEVCLWSCDLTEDYIKENAYYTT